MDEETGTEDEGWRLHNFLISNPEIETNLNLEDESSYKLVASRERDSIFSPIYDLLFRGSILYLISKRSHSDAQSCSWVSLNVLERAMLSGENFDSPITQLLEIWSTSDRYHLHDCPPQITYWRKTAHKWRPWKRIQQKNVRTIRQLREIGDKSNGKLRNSYWAQSNPRRDTNVREIPFQLEQKMDLIMAGSVFLNKLFCLKA